MSSQAIQSLSFLELAEMSAAVPGGIHIEFTKGILDYEDYPETGMRAVITGFDDQHCDESVLALHVDYAFYDKHNLELETRNYFDDSGEPTLTAREAGQYKAKDKLIVEKDKLVGNFMTIMPTQTLRLALMWKEEHADVPYMKFLEQRIGELEKRLEIAETETLQSKSTDFTDTENDRKSEARAKKKRLMAR